jgi:ABC-type phosphate transport system substrate-binding protein
MRQLRTTAIGLLVTAVLSACGGGAHRAVPLPDCLDDAAIYALVGPEAIGERQWADAAPLAEELGSRVADELPDDPIAIFGPGEESGTFDSFNELAIAGLAEERGIPEEEALARPDYTSSPNDNVIVDGVANTPGSFGWIGHAYYEQNADAVRAFAVAGADGRCVAPDDEAIASGRYPLARSLYVYVNLARAEEDQAVAAFIDRFLGDEGYQAVDEAGYVQLDPEAWAESQAAWTAAGGHPGEPASDVAGQIDVSGSSTVEPITSLLAEDFSAENPHAGVSVDGPGTGDGFELFCNGETDLSDASRPIEDEEATACADAGIDFVELQIGIDGLSLITARPGGNDG